MRKGLFTIIISILFCTSMLIWSQQNCSSQPIGWSDDVRLTNNTNNSVIPEIGIWKNYVHVFWCEQVPGPGSEYDILYKRSIDHGNTWNVTTKLIDTPYSSTMPSIAINRSTIHIVWRDNRGAGTAIYYTRSNDNGTTWIPEINISTPNAGTDECDIAIWGNNTYVVYEDYTYDDIGPQDYQLYFTKSKDNGNTWETPKRITSKIRDSNHPRIAVNGSKIHVVWMDHYDKFGNMQFGDIFYMNSTDKGLTWNEEINLTPLGNNPLDSDYPDIVINGSTLHIIYIDDRFDSTWRVHYRRSEDNGMTWSGDVTLSEPVSIISSKPRIALFSNSLNIVWGDERDGNKEIYYKNSSDKGYTWFNDLRLSFDSAISATPNVASDEKNTHVVWRDDRNVYPDIYYKRYPFYHPPGNLTIDIWGTKLTLNWTAPQNSPNPVDHYLLYRSKTWDGFNFAFPWVNTSIDKEPGESSPIPLRTIWNDTLALLDEANNYYYVVRAVYENGEIDTNENIVGKFVIRLNQGWNLISLPLAQNDTIISEVLKSIDGNYDIIQWYNAKDGIWRSSSTSLTDINRTMGLWIHMKNACNLSVVGAVPESTNIVLYEGWNLVGYPSLKARNLNNALNGISWQAVQHYDAFDANDPWKHNSTKKPDNLNDLKGMQPGCGYWVYITINDTWVRTRNTVDNKVVVWRVGESEDKIVNDHHIYDPMIQNLTELEEDNYLFDTAPDKSTTEDKENNFAYSLIPLIILIAFIFAEIVLLHKKKK